MASIKFIKKLLNKKRLSFFKKYVENPDKLDFLKSNYKVAIITPDKDIIPGADTLKPAFIVFDNYDLAIFHLEDVFNILLTMPVLYLLGYLVVAKPFYKTGLYAFSQLAGILCMALNFLIMGDEDSIYSTLLIGIYYGNILKILIYIAVMAEQQKWCFNNIIQFSLLLPFLFLPFLNYG